MTDVKRIKDTLAAGDLVVMKSDTIYGIFASALNKDAVNKLHRVRNRDSKQGFIVLIDSIDSVSKLVNVRDDVKGRLESIWRSPHPNSVILACDDDVTPEWLIDERENGPRICFRIPPNSELRQLLSETGPLCAPSANMPDLPPARNISEAKLYFGDDVALYVDGGDISDSAPSRIISFKPDGSIKTIRPDGFSHPEDFVIRRRRKLYKFARFDEIDTCYHYDDWLKVVNDKLDGDKSLTVELAAGSALFSTELARRHPERTYVAVDIKGDRLYKGATEAARFGLDNIYFVRSDIAKINEIIPDGRASEIWLTFPDPYPRKSDAKHRLTYTRYLNYYRKMLSDNGEFNFKTDSRALFDWSLDQFQQNGWQQQFLTYDMHESDASSDAKIMTTYEKRWISEGLTINYIRLLAA